MLPSCNTAVMHQYRHPKSVQSPSDILWQNHGLSISHGMFFLLSDIWYMCTLQELHCWFTFKGLPCLASQISPYWFSYNWNLVVGGYTGKKSQITMQLNPVYGYSKISSLEFLLPSKHFIIAALVLYCIPYSNAIPLLPLFLLITIISLGF